MAVLTIANTARAGCEKQVFYYVVATDDATGEIIGGHWQSGWEPVECESAGGGSYYGGGSGPSGGGSSYPAAMTTQRNLYLENECTVPSYAQFLDEAAYNATGLQNYYSFYDFSTAGGSYVLVDQRLVDGVASISLCMDNQLPSLSDPHNGAGYRLPGQNENTPCGRHTQGVAVDISTRAWDSYGNATGAHDCTMWNVLANCAHEAGGWVEPWADIKASGVIHLHVSFGQPANSPADYGDACANP